MFTSKKIDGFSIFYSIFYHLRQLRLPRIWASMEEKKLKKTTWSPPTCHGKLQQWRPASHDHLNGWTRKKVGGFPQRPCISGWFLAHFFHLFPIKMAWNPISWGLCSWWEPLSDLAPALHWKVPRLLASLPGWITKGSGGKSREQSWTQSFRKCWKLHRNSLFPKIDWIPKCYPVVN